MIATRPAIAADAGVIARLDLRAAGAVHLQLQLNAGNERGRAFYLRNGFEPRASYELHEKLL